MAIMSNLMKFCYHGMRIDGMVQNNRPVLLGGDPATCTDSVPTSIGFAVPTWVGRPSFLVKVPPGDHYRNWPHKSDMERFQATWTHLTAVTKCLPPLGTQQQAPQMGWMGSPAGCRAKAESHLCRGEHSSGPATW